MDVETRNHTTTLANSRIPEMLGTFHLDGHNVQEWSDAIGHKARKEVGKWIDRDRNADVRFQRHEDSKQSEKSSEQQRTEVIQGNAPDAAFQIVRSQRKFQDADSGRVTTMSTSYQMSSSVGTRSTSKTTSNKTSTKTVTVSGGSNRSDDFESLGLTFQPLDTSTQRGRILISRSGTMGVRRPPTRRPTPVTITAVSPEPEEEVVVTTSSTKSNADSSKLNQAQSYTVETFEDSTTTASSETSRQINGHRDSHPSAFSVPTKNLSSKIRVGFPVEIQLELQSKLRYSATEDQGSQPIIIESVDDDDDDDGINSSPSPRDDGLGGSPDMTSSSSEDKLNEIRQSFASTNKQLSSSYKKTTTSSQDSAIDVLNGYSDNVYEHTNGFHESRKRDNKIIEHKITLAAASDSEPDDSAYDFARRRKSFGFESIDLRKNNKSLSAFKNTNNADSNTSSRSSQIDLLHYSPKYSAASVLRRTPPSLSKSWDVLQGTDGPETLNGIDNRTNNNSNNKRFSSSSMLNRHMDNNGYSKNSSSNRLKVPQKTVVTVNGAPSTTTSSQENMLSNLIRDSDNFTRNKRNTKLSDLYRNESNLASSVTNLSFSVEDALDTVHNHQRSASSSNEQSNRPAETIGAAMSKYVGKQDTQQEPSSSSFKKSLENFEKFGVFQKDWKRDQLRAGELTTLENDLEELNESLNKILQGDDLVSVYAKITPQIGKGVDQQNRMLLSGSVERLNKKERPALADHQEHQDNNDLLSSSMDQHGKASHDNNKVHQISHTWISPVDQRPSQKVRDKDVTTTISATNDPSRKNSKKVEFCKTEVHFTPESGKFNIVESLEDKPPTVHLFRRRKNKDKNKGTSSSGGDGGLASVLTTTTKTPTPKTPTTDTSYEQGQNTESSSSSSSSSYLKNYHAITEELKSKLDASSSSTSSGGEPAKSTQGPTTLPSTSVGGGNEQSCFHPWNQTNVGSRNDARPQVVTPPLLDTPGHINPSHQNINNNYITSNTSDSSNNISYNKDPISSSIRKDFDSVRKSSTLIQDTLNAEDYTQEYDQDYNDASGTHLNEYGQLKIQRYLKQLKTPSSVNGSEESSSTDNFVDDDADNDDEGTLSRQDNHILYENGSFIPSATRKSLIEMNNRNRKRTQHQSNVSDKSSSAASSYSLPHSERNYINNDHYVTNPFSSRLPVVEATVSTKDVPKITSVDVRYNLYDDRPQFNDFFNENATPNFRNGARAASAYNNDSEDDLQDLVEPVQSRSVPPYFRSTSYENTYRPPSPLEETSSSKHFNKPPIPILPTQFANFEKTGAALRERSKLKSQSLAASRESNYSNGDSSRTSQPQTNKSIVNIGPAESDDFDTAPFEPSSTRFESLSPNFNDSEQLLDSFEDSQQQEPILSLDHTWKGPAHFEHQNQLRGPSMTLPKSGKPEPEWVQKARSREARVTDWNLIGKQQQGSTSSESKPDPPWLSEIRTKTKPPTSNGVTIDEYGTTTGKPDRNAPPKQSWQKEPRVLTIPRVSSPESEAEPTYLFADANGKSTVITEIEEQQRNLYNEGVYMPPVNGHFRPGHYDLSSSQLPSGSQENNHYTERQNTTKTTTTTSAPSPVIGHRDEDIIHYQEIQEPEQIDPKLLAPLLETPKRASRKPLHSNTNINKRAPPELPKPRTLPKPPRPPERYSSLVRKTAASNSSRYNPIIPPTDKKSASPLNKQHNPPLPACRSRLPSPRITPPREHPTEDPLLRPKHPGTPEFQHPCVQVAKIPKAGQQQGTLPSANKTKPPSPRIDAKTSHESTSNSRNKPKNHVALVNETKIMCNSKLLGGSNGGRAQTSNPQPSTTTRTHKRSSRTPANNLAHKKR